MAEKRVLDGLISKNQYQYKKEIITNSATGEKEEIYFNTYQEYERERTGSIDPGTLQTYLLVNKGGTWYKGAKLGEDGKWQALTEKEGGIYERNNDITKPGTFKPIPNASDNIILGEGTVRDLNAGGTNSLRYIAINNAKFQLKKGGGLSEAEVNRAFDISNNIRPPAGPETPGLFGDAIGADQATGVPQTDPNVPETIDYLNKTFDSNARPLSDFLKGPYSYPTSIDSNGQDYIQFTLYEYGTRSVNSPTQDTENIENLFKLSDRFTAQSTPIGTVFLPIQQGISDQSMVSWADENMSPLAMALMQSAANPESIGGNLEKIGEKVTTNQKYREMIQQQLYGAAAGVNPLARLSGLVVNPNLELLFNGPTLRPFNFTFRLSPRSETEAKQVKNIINWFKLGSVVRTTTDNLFLKAPNVFNIQYVYGKDKEEHPGLNRIKTCALRSMNVNYNPDGSYMTFEDGTMTSYEMTLQFSELEPVYDVDYNQIPINSIGY